MIDFSTHSFFKAIFSDGVLIAWQKPSSFSYVYKMFKFYGESGVLLCDNKVIRTTGRDRVAIEAIIDRLELTLAEEERVNREECELFDDYMDEVGFDPYEGCYTFDC